MQQILHRPRAGKDDADLQWLAASPIAPGVATMQNARNFHEWLVAEAKTFLARRGKRFPAPDHILNPRPRREGVRHV